MARWTSTLTTAGAALLAGVSGHLFNFTKAQCGSGTVSEEDLAAQTEVTGVEKNLSITQVTRTGTMIKLRLQLSNVDIEDSFDLYQIGIFAKLDADPSDTLLMIIQADTPDHVPSATESPNYVNDYIVNVPIGAAAEIAVNIDLAAHVTIGQMAEHITGSKPHIFLDEEETPYKYGFRAENGRLIFMYEEVEE